MLTFLRILAVVLVVMTIATTIAAGMFSYAGFMHGNTDWLLTTVVWSTVVFYVYVTVAVSQRVF